MKRAMILAATLVASGCTASVSGPESGRYTGLYSQGFEVDSFQPCGSRESWWVTDGEELRRRYRAIATAQYQQVYVELRGTIGPEGKYGHMGAHTRELSVQEVLTIREARQTDCG